MTDEIWKPIPEYPGYEASNTGRIRSLRRKNVHILSPSLNSNGYLGVSLVTENGRPHRRGIAFLVLLAFVGPRPEGMDVCHGDGNKVNNRRDNLRYDTRKGNLRDNYYNKVSRAQLERLRTQYRAGVSINKLAKIYGVSQGCIEKRVEDIEYSRSSKGASVARSIREEYARGGISYSGLARKYGMSFNYAAKILIGYIYPEAGGPIRGKRGNQQS